jgi:GNAT superfamily N-acetyltransferase
MVSYQGIMASLEPAARWENAGGMRYFMKFLLKVLNQTELMPAGYIARPATLDDVAAAVELFNAQSMALQGVTDYQVETLRREWEFPGFNMAADTQVALTAEGQLVGYYDVFSRGAPYVNLSVWGRIHPDHMAVGDTLLAWAEQRARQIMTQAPVDARLTLTAHPLALDTATCQLLERAGFKVARHSMRMVIDLDEEPAAPVWPDGLTVRTAVIEDDLPAVVAAVRDSWQDHWGYVESPFEEELAHWRHSTKDESFDPTLWFLAVNRDGELAGVNLCRPKISDDPEMGWVGTLAVRRPWRRNGLGLALLHHAFGEFYRRGKRRVGLGVDAQSLTGATRLYERAGMRSDPKWQRCTYVKELRPGVDWATQEVTE